MDDRVRLPLNFDAKRLQSDLAVLNSFQWIDHFVPQNYDGRWTVIPLRAPESATHPVMMISSDPNCSSFVDTPFLEATDYLPDVLGELRCPVGSARLMKLGAGSVIRQHADLDLDAADGTARLHVPIQTNPGIDFRLNGSRVVLAAGECWYLRLSDPHSVTNGGNTDRVHLVVDVEVNRWLLDMLEPPVATN